MREKREIIVDNFAGGGGTDTGIEYVTGRSVDIAINHDPLAVEMHKMNHPSTKHYCESVWEVDPVEACAGRPVGLVWFSPDCKHFSKAKGGKPVEKKIRGLAWIVLKWAALVRPRVIMLENVEEFQSWGPVMPKRDPKTGRIYKYTTLNHTKSKYSPRMVVAEKGETVPVEYQVMKSDPKRKGQTYEKWRQQLEALGYEIDTKVLVAADYGAPTRRKRFFMIARCDGKPIVWPKPTHGHRDSIGVKHGKLKPYIPAADIIDWSIPCKSIFDRPKPLAENTMKRIAKGLEKFVFNNAEPFIVQVNHSGANWHYCNSIKDPLPTITGKHGFGIVTPYMTQIGQTGFSKDRSSSLKDPIKTVVTKNEHCLIAPTLIQYHTETGTNQVRGQNILDPMMTIDSSPRYGLVSAFIDKYCPDCFDTNKQMTKASGGAIVSDALCASHIIQMNNNMIGTDMREPLNTIVAGPGHIGEVRAFLIKYYGQGIGQSLEEPLDTVVSKDRFGLITIYGVKYVIVDIGLRMLEPHELYAAHGFPADYIIDTGKSGKRFSKAKQVHFCGNSVPPPFSAALVKANLPELCTGTRMPHIRVDRVKEDANKQLKFIV